MRRPPCKEYCAHAALVFGVLFFGMLQFVMFLLIQEGVITFWMARRVRVFPPIREATSTPEVVYVPDRTRPLAVMIDDHPDAMPQSGLADADVVWEALVEGGLTRLMAVYRSVQADEVGPVRSARPYFLQWAREHDAVYAHVGGSDEALRILASDKLGLDDVNEFTTSAAFWRDKTLSAPHNTYTSTGKIREVIAARGWGTETEALEAALRADVAPEGVPAASAVVIASKHGYPTEFRYENGAWTRVQGGKPVHDRDGDLEAPKTVVVLEMDVTKVADPQGKGLIGLANIGTGKATVLREGRAIVGTWRKTSAADQTQIYGEDGRKIPFAIGQLWFTIIAPNRGGTLELR